MRSDSSSSSFESIPVESTISVQIARNLIDNILTKEQQNRFSPAVDINEKILYAETLIHEHKLYPDDIQMKIPKNNKDSSAYCDEGDEQFDEGDTDEALRFYNRCIIYAETNSEFLSRGYARRSRVFQQLGLYKESLTDIALAKNLNNSPSKTNDELEKRKEECEKAIQLSTSTPSASSSSSAQQSQQDLTFLTQLSYPKHPNIPFIANCLELTETSEYGRSIITNCDLEPGDVIAIEKPFAALLAKICKSDFCSYCLKETFSLIPCPSCTSAMFCNEKCLKQAYEKFHKYECQVSNLLIEVAPERVNYARILIQLIEMFKDIDQLINFENNTGKDTNIFMVGSDQKCSADVDEDEDATHMTPLSYYAYHGLTIYSEQPELVSEVESLCYAVDTVLTTKLLFEILKDTIITDQHKRFVRNFIYRHLARDRLFINGLQYARELEFDPISPMNYHLKYGVAIYPFAGLINHSCAPNVQQVYNGATLTNIVTRPIGIGEQIFTNYGDYFWMADKNERQLFTKNQHNFECKCEACERDYPLSEHLPSSEGVPVIDLSVAQTDLTVVNKSIKDYFKFLCIHSNDTNYPCKELENLERKLQILLDYSLRHR